MDVEMIKGSSNIRTCVHKVLTSSCCPPASLRATAGALNQKSQPGVRRSGQTVFNLLVSGDLMVFQWYVKFSQVYAAYD